jgi:predicted nucleic acid-binding protein
MRRIFADTYYWIALLNDQDQGHAAAQAIAPTLRGVTICTTQEVLIEFLNFFSERGRYPRIAAVAFADGILSNRLVSVQLHPSRHFSTAMIFTKPVPTKNTA